MGQRWTLTETTKPHFDRFFETEQAAGRTVTVEILQNTKDDELNRRINGFYRNLAGQVDGHSFSDIRALTKLHVGIPLMREHSEAYREKYDGLIKDRFDYAEKLALMIEPAEFPVTSAMSIEIKTEYCKRLRDFWAQRGYLLTVDED